MDEKKFETLSEQQQKKFLFKENIRLNELSQSLEEDRQLIDIQKGMLRSQQRKNQLMKKQLESQQSLFDQKWTILEKERFNREKLMYRDKVYREARRTMADAENVKIFFKGVNDTDSVKKRYKDLLKIYHPDNTHGDNNIVLAINEEYERLLRFYLGT